MKKTQWAVLITALIVTILLYLLTQDKVFGVHTKHSADDGHGHNTETELSADTIIHHAKEKLTAEQRNRIGFLENSISRGNVNTQKIHLFHQLAVFWRDTARVFEPFAWYTAEASRLENSEKSLTFAAHLFLDNLRSEENPELKRWKALQSKDLFERSLKINPRNDSSTVGLGATYLFGGLESPMEGIRRIRSVTEQHPDNIYAQLTMGEASLISGQTDKAIERFQTVLKLDPENLQAILSLADVYERKGDKQEAIKWYKKSLPIIKGEMIRQAVENRINELSL
jgi:tetratricopeptide (TPR) repeat protein